MALFHGNSTAVAWSSWMEKFIELINPESKMKVSFVMMRRGANSNNLISYIEMCNNN
jgi:hypothetical protein